MTEETDKLKTTLQLALDAIDKKNWRTVGQRLDEAQSQVRVIIRSDRLSRARCRDLRTDASERGSAAFALTRCGLAKAPVNIAAGCHSHAALDTSAVHRVSR